MKGCYEKTYSIVSSVGCWLFKIKKCFQADQDMGPDQQDPNSAPPWQCQKKQVLPEAVFLSQVCDCYQNAHWQDNK